MSTTKHKYLILHLATHFVKDINFNDAIMARIIKINKQLLEDSGLRFRPKIKGGENCDVQSLTIM